MLKKELTTGAGEEAHVLMTVGQHFYEKGDMDVYYAGWSNDSGGYGKVDKVPYWKTPGVDRVLKGIFCTWTFDSYPNSTSIEKEAHEKDYMGAIIIEINGAKVGCNLDGPNLTTRTAGDPFNLKGSVGKVIPIRFTPPPNRISIRKSSRYLPALERRAW